MADKTADARPPDRLPPQMTLLRAAAFVLDTLALALFLVIPSTVASYSVAMLGPSAKAITQVWYGALAILVVATLLRDGFRRGGGSPGKRLLGLRVLTHGGEPCGYGKSIVRNLPWFVPLWNLVDLYLMVRGRPRTGDRIAGTTIIEE